MKRITSFCIIVLFAAIGQALATPISFTNNGIYIVVAAAGEFVYPLVTNEPFRYDSRLIWEPFSNVGYVRMVHANPSYAFRFRMSGPNGKQTPKTTLGREYGSRFDQIGSDPREISSRGASEIDAQARYDIRDDVFTGRSLPPPNDLFEMDEPGIYTLELEFQLSGPHSNTNMPGLELLRFPPMKIMVEKPLTAPCVERSVINQGIYLSIIATKTNRMAAFDDCLAWRISYENQDVMLRGLDSSCGLKMNLTGPDGKEVLKTARGRMIGVDFDSVHKTQMLPPGTKLSDVDSGLGQPGAIQAQPLPFLKDCFVMDKTGIYTLELQMQFVRINHGTGSQPGHDEIVRLPPMTIRVNQP